MILLIAIDNFAIPYSIKMFCMYCFFNLCDVQKHNVRLTCLSPVTYNRVHIAKDSLSDEDRIHRYGLFKSLAHTRCFISEFLRCLG